MELPEMKSAVWTIVFIGMLLGVGMFILQTFRDTTETTETGSVGPNGTMTTMVSGTPVFLEENIQNSTFSVGNETGDYLFKPGLDYYLNPVTGYITPTDAGIASGADKWNFTYSFNYRPSNSASSAVNTTLAGISEFPEWLKIIAIVIAASVIIGLMVSKLGGMGGVV